MATRILRPVTTITATVTVDDPPTPAATAHPGGHTPPAPKRADAPAVQVRGLSRAFGARSVIDGLDLDIDAGTFVALLGRSGCGKSTLLRVLAGLDRDADGQVVVPRRRAVAFQEPRLLPWKRVWRNVSLGLTGPQPRERALAALDEVELGHRTTAWPLTLSGGEAQRAALARALVRDPDLLLLDEPTASLDALTRLRMQGLIASLWERHAPAVVLVTHDVDEALALADRALVMRDGRIHADLPVRVPRPRDPADPQMSALRVHLLDLLGVRQH
ncbi:sulfonate transport system ATP-binding protein [Parafrankia irregularis]|uniref:Sulfonate transport system ATP-binding protein n=1 Tax=Parafrankia irregularis TaxID=795642 RepID=A0A0S4QMU9_9ACTN|nr:MULTISPECIES: ABC transporter ATP-binding protein [Parafrankia]MBE3201166.1 ABC transporter ATP-binding protein [Parafrankia sp. CH37]CUU56399.1 sulfonate transport system ATP-binding protein [Parafrankia irregularis]